MFHKDSHISLDDLKFIEIELIKDRYFHICIYNKNKYILYNYLLLYVNTIYHKDSLYFFLVGEKVAGQKYLLALQQSHRDISGWLEYSWFHELPEDSIVAHQFPKRADLMALASKHL